jgi:hypothetical protein
VQVCDVGLRILGCFEDYHTKARFSQMMCGGGGRLYIHHSLTHRAEPFLRSRQLCSHSRTSQHFMEPEGSFPSSQEPSTGPHSEPDRSNPYHPISLRSILILSTTYVFVFPVVSFLLVSPSISYMRSSSPHSCYMPGPSHPP